MSKNKIKNDQLMVILYRALCDILEDETGHPSYRIYFDKVTKDIFGVEDVGTGFLMATEQFKFLKRLLKDPESKGLCQMLLRKDDVKVLRQLVRALYDITQISNKPKKKITTKDIKSYRYLTDLYMKSVKKLRKKYKTDYVESKKSYKNKYSELDRLVDGKYKTPYYAFGDNDYIEDDDNESLEEYIDDDEETDELNGLDISDLPTQFIIKSTTKSSVKKNHLILDGDDDNIELYDEESEEEDDDGVMPQKEFQQYTISLFEKLIDRINEIPKAPDNSTTLIMTEYDEDSEPDDNSNTEISDDATQESAPVTEVTCEELADNLPLDYIGDPYPVNDSASTSVDDNSNLEVATKDPDQMIPAESTYSSPIETNKKKDYHEMSTEQLISEFNDTQLTSAHQVDDPNSVITVQNSD